MNNYSTQSYFSALCDVFYITIGEVRKQEIKEEELEATCPSSELEVITSLLKAAEHEELQKKYVVQKFTIEELEERKKELSEQLQAYRNNYKVFKEESRVWSLRYQSTKDEIIRVLDEVKKEKGSLIISSTNQIFALMIIFNEKEIKNYKVINTNELYLRSFPVDDMAVEFFRAYTLEDGKGMRELVKKYL